MKRNANIKAALNSLINAQLKEGRTSLLFQLLSRSQLHNARLSTNGKDRSIYKSNEAFQTANLPSIVTLLHTCSPPPSHSGKNHHADKEKNKCHNRLCTSDYFLPVLHQPQTHIQRFVEWYRNRPMLNTPSSIKLFPADVSIKSAY